MAYNYYILKFTPEVSVKYKIDYCKTDRIAKKLMPTTTDYAYAIFFAPKIDDETWVEDSYEEDKNGNVMSHCQYTYVHPLFMKRHFHPDCMKMTPKKLYKYFCRRQALVHKYLVGQGITQNKVGHKNGVFAVVQDWECYDEVGGNFDMADANQFYKMNCYNLRYTRPMKEDGTPETEIYNARLTEIRKKYKFPLEQNDIYGYINFDNYTKEGHANRVSSTVFNPLDPKFYFETINDTMLADFYILTILVEKTKMAIKCNESKPVMFVQRVKSLSKKKFTVKETDSIAGSACLKDLKKGYREVINYVDKDDELVEIFDIL